MPPVEWPVTAEAIYRVYFHGPAYRVLAGVKVEGEGAVGLMAADLPPDVEPAEAELLMAPRLIELCFQTAGIWQIEQQHVLALPAGIGQVAVYRQAAEANGRRLYALVEAVNQGGQFNGRVVDEAGNVYLSLEGYRTVALPGTAKLT